MDSDYERYKVQVNKTTSCPRNSIRITKQAHTRQAGRHQSINQSLGSLRMTKELTKSSSSHAMSAMVGHDGPMTVGAVGTFGGIVRRPSRSATGELSSSVIVAGDNDVADGVIDGMSDGISDGMTDGTNDGESDGTDDNPDPPTTSIGAMAIVGMFAGAKNGDGGPLTTAGAGDKEDDDASSSPPSPSSNGNALYSMTLSMTWMTPLHAEMSMLPVTNCGASGALSFSRPFIHVGTIREHNDRASMPFAIMSKF